LVRWQWQRTPTELGRAAPVDRVVRDVRRCSSRQLNERLSVAFTTSIRTAEKSSMSVGKLLGGLVVALFCVLLGLLVALLPPGLLIRLLVLPMGIGILGLCWLLRRKGAGLPGGLTLSVWLGAVFLSVLWPRYIFFSVGGPSVNPETLAVLASLALVAFWFVYSPEFSTKFTGVLFGPSRIGLLAMVWLAWRMLASLLGDYPLLSSLEYLRDLAYVSAFLLIGCAVVVYDGGPKWLLRVVVVAGFIAALLGLIEAFVQKNFFIQFASAGDSQAVSNALKTIAFDKTRDGSYRAQSVFDHPIVFAQFVAALIPLGSYLAFYERRWVWRLLGLMVVPVGFLAILKSGSRAGLVSIAVGLVFIMAFFWLRGMMSTGFKRAFSMLALPLFFVGLLLAYFVVQELVLGRSHVEASSTSVRLKMVADGVAALYESPAWGFGYGMAITKAGVISGHTGVATIDSFMLTIALDSGYVGLFLFLAVLVNFTIKGAVVAAKISSSEGAFVGMLVAAVLALAATFVGLSISNNMTLFWLLVAASLPYLNNAHHNRPRLWGRA
jgi:hypothetical protein